MSIYRVMMCAVLAFIFSGCDAHGEAPKDICVNSSKGVCLIPYELLFDSRSLGRVVSVRGVFHVMQGIAGVYRSEDDARFGLRENAIFIQNPELGLSGEDLLALDGKMVVVTGKVFADKRLYWSSVKLTRPIAEVPMAWDLNQDQNGQSH